MGHIKSGCESWNTFSTSNPNERKKNYKSRNTPNATLGINGLETREPSIELVVLQLKVTGNNFCRTFKRNQKWNVPDVPYLNRKCRRLINENCGIGNKFILHDIAKYILFKTIRRNISLKQTHRYLSRRSVLFVSCCCRPYSSVQ